MIIPKKDSKSYGTFHHKGDTTIEGFCKSLISNNFQSVDILINNNKLDTIVSNQSNNNLDNIYNCSNSCFTYELDYSSINYNDILSIKNSITGEDLNNSPITLEQFFYPSFYKNIFNKSLKDSFPLKVTDTYCKNSIGILITSENLKDKDFTNYILELMNRLPNSKFNFIYFNDLDKNNSQQVFNKIPNKIEYLRPSNLEDITRNIEIFISYHFDDRGLQKLFLTILKFCKNILAFQYFPFMKNLKFKDYPRKLNKIEIDEYAKKLNLTLNDLKKANYNYYQTLFNYTMENCLNKTIQFDINLEMFKFINIDVVSLALENETFKRRMFEFRSLLITV